MDEPFHLLFKEVMQQYPEAKMILPLRDPESWYNSYLHFFSQHVIDPVKTVFDAMAGITHSGGTSLLQRGALRRRQNVSTTYEDICGAALYWGCDFLTVQTAELKARCIGGFNRHVAEVKAHVPPDKLLLFNLSDGWGPLVKFIGVPEPTVPFPHTDIFVEHPSLLEKSQDESFVWSMKAKAKPKAK
eukprot:TRINITY_DN3633_c0_g1_i2.p1 TRINITY_DN3633_c0_g1~~TRINITY_DN3633_c0_g1_i2.p1  ORF type:complete len:210 (+),score=34.72 TRINITY_DN3633_c0_g1_i2:72-632(+)